MSSVILFRLAARTWSQPLFRPHQAARQLPVLAAASPVSVGCSCFSTSVPRAAADHHEESFEEFTARYVRTHWTKAITCGQLGELRVGGIRQRSFGRFQWVMTDPEPRILDMRRSSTPSRMCLNYRCVSIRKNSAPIVIHGKLTIGPPNEQRNLNNAFAYDLVPSPSVITAALKAARRVNDYPTAVRIFEGTSSAQIWPRYKPEHFQNKPDTDAFVALQESKPKSRIKPNTKNTSST